MSGPLLDTSVFLNVVLAILAGGVLVALVRLLKGPTLPDRVVAIDLIAIHAVAMLAVLAMASEEPSLLQPALVVALIAFLGTVAFARYVEKGARR